MKVSLLDYGAGNVRSVRNAIRAAGYSDIHDIQTPQDIDDAACIVFPGVGSFQTAMQVLQERGFVEPLQRYLSNQDRPFLGICLGMQTLFESSQETGENHGSGQADAGDRNGNDNGNNVIAGLGIVPGVIKKFDESAHAVPHIGWNGRMVHQADSPALQSVGPNDETYFVHSYYAELTDANRDWVLCSTMYDNERFISAIQKGAVVATQFHPEKSGATGLNILKGFLDHVAAGTMATTTSTVAPSLPTPTLSTATVTTQLTKRVVVALDVRSNDDGDLVVTKGDQYDVREKEETVTIATDDSGTSNTRAVRNLGKPVALAKRYYDEGADEIAFLNITSFRQGVIEDMPMLHVLEEASKQIFVPLTVGGGIRSYTDPVTQQTWSALQVASRYFRAGADKVSLGSDAVEAAQQLVANAHVATGQTAIEQISKVYGVQAVVVSIDPKRVYLAESDDAAATTNPNHVVVDLDTLGPVGPNDEKRCWYQCTVKGGRETRDICAVTVAKAVERLGAGEIMLNCINMDGQGQGFDLALMQAVSSAVSIPVIASSGAGQPEHFTNVFTQTGVQAALAAGMFHRKEVEINAVKQHMRDHGIPARQST